MKNGKSLEQNGQKAVEKQQKGVIILSEQAIETIFQSEDNKESSYDFLSKEEIETLYDAAYYGTSRSDAVVLLGKKSNEAGLMFSQVFTRGRLAGELELKRLYFEKARKGDMRTAHKIFNQNEL